MRERERGGGGAPGGGGPDDRDFFLIQRQNYKNSNSIFILKLKEVSEIIKKRSSCNSTVVTVFIYGTCIGPICPIEMKMIYREI